MDKNFIVVLLSLVLLNISSKAQENERSFIKLVQPSKESNSVSSAQQFIIGSTCKSCRIKINDDTVKVYPTGGFAYEVSLKENDNTFEIVADNGKKSTKKIIKYIYTQPLAPKPLTDLNIEYINTYPSGNLWLQPGDPIYFKVKTLTHCTVKAENIPLFEIPDSLTKGMTGIYQGKYIIKATDSFYNKKMMISVKLNDSAVLYRETGSRFTVMHPDSSNVVMTKGRLAYLEYGLGDDRLGGAKMGYLDSLIPLKVVGKVGSDYKVQLSKNRTAYIPEEHVSLLPPGYFPPSSLTGKIRLTTDSVYDYVNLQLFNRLPYQSFQQLDPSRIVVDVFGATSNTNWIDQPEYVKEIKKVEYEQLSDDVYRMIITLNHKQHWGHKVFYSGNNLVVSVKRQPQDLSLNKLTIALDAGHGGSNTGAGGATGVAEKEIALQITKRIKLLLEAEGANVIMTREKELFFDNKERILFYRDSTPDLLLSIHLNSANDPFRFSGTSTFYRYEGFRPLSRSIYKRLLELGLKEYGNNGAFNFMLNGPTEYPNALIETLFLSNLEEETKVLDPVFQEQMAEKIVQGVKDFLEGQ
jgi:N-acetylmuramoyl-L-alanine amidase